MGSAGSPGNRHSTHAAFPLEKMSRPVKTGRALINPFDPSHVTIKLTSNRRRWTHIFPKGFHHYHYHISNSAIVFRFKLSHP